MKLFVDILFALAVVGAILFGFWHWFGPFGLVFGAPILGLFAKPMVRIVTGFPRFASNMAMRRYEGRYYEFRGRSMDIHCDLQGRAWIATADARKVAALPNDEVLGRLAPSECGRRGEPVAWRITTDALRPLLAKSSDPEVARFSDWLEKEVAEPARKRLERGMALN